MKKLKLLPVLFLSLLFLFPIFILTSASQQPSAPETPAQEPSVLQIPARETSLSENPSQGAPSTETSSQELLAPQMKAQEAPQEVPLEDISAQEIVRRADNLMRGDTQEGKYTMTIFTPSWQRHLKLLVYSKGRDRVFIRILSPAKEKGITTLRIKNEMWNYLPSVERTIKIPPSMMLQPWMGSDFANDDLVKESSIVDDYIHKIAGEENIDKKAVWRIELTPKPDAAVVWYKRIMWIRKDGFIPVRDEFYGKDSKLIKVLEYSQVKKISDRLIPAHWEMTSKIKKSRRTIIEVDENLVYNEPIEDSVFTLQNLKSM